MRHVTLLIVGAGAAGMAAALAAEQTLLTYVPDADPHESILLVEREKTPGGVLRQCVHEGFGLGYFSKNMTGTAYMEAFTGRLSHSKVQVLCDT